jgi:hypothetical protein
MIGTTSKPANLVLAVCLLTVFFPAAGTIADSGGSDADCIDQGAVNAEQDQTVTVCKNTEITEPIEITKSGVTLTGEEGATINVTGSDEGTAAVSVAAEGVTVSDLTIERHSDTERGGSSSFAQAVRVAASDVTIADNTIVGSLGDANNAGVMVLDGTGNAPRTVENVTVTGNEVRGFAYGLGAAAAYDEGASVSEVTFTDNNVNESSEAGIALADGNALTVLGLPEGDPPAGDEPTIEDATARNNEIVNNTLGVLNAAATTLDARFNWWGTPAGPASELFAGAVVAAPWCTDPGCSLDEDPGPPEGPSVPENQSAVEIISPASGAAFAPDANLTVTWFAPIDDLFVNEMYIVELLDDGSEDRGVVTSTGPDEACTPLDVDTWRCQATLEDVPQGEDYTITVRPTVTQNDTLADASSPLCYATSMAAGTPILCDFVSDITAGEITTLSPRPDDGWTNTAYEGTITCEAEPCEINYDVHDPSEESGPYTVTDTEASVTIDQEGQRQLSWFGADENGNEEEERSDTVKLDQTPPSTERTELDGTEGNDGWFTSDVTAHFSASDSLSGVDRIEHTVDDEDEQTGDTRDVTGDATHTLSYRSVDVATNDEDWTDETVKIDTTDPTTTSTLDGEQEDGVYVEPVTVTLDADDESSGVAETEYKLDDGSWTTYDGSFQIEDDGNHTLAYRSTDVAGNQEAASEESFEIDTPAVIDLELRDHNTFLPNDEQAELVFEATWEEGENAGEPADGETVVLTDANDDSFEETETTNADGLGSFTFEEADLQRDLEATIQNPSESADVLEPDATTVTWTDLAIDRLASEDVTDATQGWANVGDTYRVAYQVNTTWNGQPLEGATVELDSGEFASTDEDGIARVPTDSEELNETTFTAEASYNPSNGPQQTVSADETATVKWAQVVYENLNPDPGEATNWYDAGEDRTFSFEAYLDYGDGRVAAEDAEVTIEAASETSDADETTTVTVAGDGTASSTLSFADNAKTTPTLSLDSTEEGISVQQDADFGDQRWATLVVDQLAVTNEETDAYDDGWHAVGDEVTFDLQADLVYGADRTEDATPATDTDLNFSLNQTETITVGQNGSETLSRTFDDPLEATPTIELDSSPEGITATDIDAFEKQRWTELDLQVTPDDDFVNVGDEVTFDLEASWTHAEGPAASGVDVVVENASGEQVKDCETFSDTSQCTLGIDQVYADGLTFVASQTDVGVTQQTDDEATTSDVIWTQIEATDLGTDDAFVDVGEPVTMTGQADYAHTDDTGEQPAVANSTLALGASADDSCTLDTGVVTDGHLTATVTCSEVVDQRVPLVVDTNEEDVTALAEPLEVHDTERDENAVWTGFEVSYHTIDDEGNQLENGTLLDHNEPVRFNGTVELAHMTDDEGTAPPTDSVQFRVLENGDTESSCLEDLNETGSASCITEVRKEEGDHTFDVGASSFETDDAGFFYEDVTEVTNEPDPANFRWTSISFLEFECYGSASQEQDCQEDFQASEQVTVTVTAVAGDDETQVLDGADITIDGNQEATDEDGQASRDFLGWSGDCLDITAAGEEAEIDGQTVTWDQPRTETICWG